MGDQVEAKRICLRCNRPFKSKGAGNRICNTCTKANAKQGMQIKGAKMSRR